MNELQALNCKTTQVPTNLFFALDCNLRNTLTVLLHLSSVFADADGYFSVTNAELQNYLRLGKNLTSVCLETLFRNKLILTKIEVTRSKKQIIMYRVNVERFADFDKYNFKTICDNDTHQIETLSYGKNSGFIATYCHKNTETSGNTPSSPSNESDGEIPTSDLENASTALETASNENEQYYTVSEVDEDVVFDAFGNDITEEWNDLVEQSKHQDHDIKDEWQEPKDELDEILGEDSETELEQAEEPIVETASVFSVDLPRVEKRSLRQENLDDAVKQKLFDLLERYKAMTITKSDEAFEKCNDACRYVKRQYDQGFIDFETKDRLIRDFVNARFEKFII